MQPQDPNQINQQTPTQAEHQSSMFQPTVAPLQPLPSSQSAGSSSIALGKPRRSIAHLITLILLVLLLIASSGFAIWAYTGMLDYKDNSDQKSVQAVEIALEEQKIRLDQEFAEKSKEPYIAYNGPASAGSLKIVYPKTWSAYVVEEGAGSTVVSGYYHPGFVPKTIGNDVVVFALRVEVLNADYSQQLRQFEPFIKQGTLRAQAFSPAKVSGSIGLKLSGQISPGRTNIDGTMVLIPMRDKTLKIWTESNSAFLADFENAVLGNLEFNP